MIFNGFWFLFRDLDVSFNYILGRFTDVTYIKPYYYLYLTLNEHSGIWVKKDNDNSPPKLILPGALEDMGVGTSLRTGFKNKALLANLNSLCILILRLRGPKTNKFDQYLLKTSAGKQLSPHSGLIHDFLVFGEHQNIIATLETFSLRITTYCLNRKKILTSVEIPFKIGDSSYDQVKFRKKFGLCITRDERFIIFGTINKKGTLQENSYEFSITLIEVTRKGYVKSVSEVLTEEAYFPDSDTFNPSLGILASNKTQILISVVYDEFGQDKSSRCRLAVLRLEKNLGIFSSSSKRGFFQSLKLMGLRRIFEAEIPMEERVRFVRRKEDESGLRGGVDAGESAAETGVYFSGVSRCIYELTAQMTLSEV